MVSKALFCAKLTITSYLPYRKSTKSYRIYTRAMELDSLGTGSGAEIRLGAERQYQSSQYHSAVTLSLTKLGRLGMGHTTSTSLFRTIPPERVGLNGEYDHDGLAKRVMLAFKQKFSPEEIATLRVTQRGAVVILMGKIANQQLLNQLVDIAMQVSGAADVEINGVGVADRFTSYLDRSARMALLHALGAINHN
jgi:hypothetical protein